MNVPRWLRWLWTAAVVLGMLNLIWTRQWMTILVAALVGCVLGIGAAVYERAGNCLPWDHQWMIRRVSPPMWDPLARGELRTCTHCGKVTAR